MAKTNMILVAAVAIVVIIAIVGFLAFSKPSSQATTTTQAGTGSSVYTSSATSAATTTAPSTTSIGELRTYTGTFNYTIPLGPANESVQGSNISAYNSTQTEFGTFSFTTNSTYAIQPGYGSGSGKATVVTSGYCQGTNSTTYTFPVNTIVLSSTNSTNMTVIFGAANPENSTVNLSCTNPSNNQKYSLTGNYSFISVYPPIISLNQSGGKINAVLSGGISYNITIKAQ